MTEAKTEQEILLRARLPLPARRLSAALTALRGAPTTSAA